MAICFRSFPNRFITANVNNCIATRKHVHRTVSSRDYPNESLSWNKYTEESCWVNNACLFDSAFSNERNESCYTRNTFPGKAPVRTNYTALAKERCPIPDDIVLWTSGIGSEVMKLSDNYKSSLFLSSLHTGSSSNLEYERSLRNLYRAYLSETSRENLESVLVLSSKLNMSSQGMPKPKAAAADSDKKPTIEQLENILQVLSKDLPYIFLRQLDYTIYDPQLVFENNYRGVRMVGLSNYITSISLMKMASHLRFAYVRMEIINITKHTEEGTVKVRWRIRGLSGYKVFLLFWRIKIWKLKESLKEHETWYDGFSVFHVNGEGKVYKHVLDKMQPDDDKEELVQKTPLAAKLGLLLGLTPRTTSSLSDLSPMAWGSVLDELGERDARLVSQLMAQLMLPLEKIE